MDVAVQGERPQDGQLVGGQPGGTEHRQPRREVDRARIVLQQIVRPGQAFGRACYADPPAYLTPEFRLPLEVPGDGPAGTVPGVAGCPRADHRGSLRSVRV